VVNPGSRVAVIIPSGSLEIEAPIRAGELKYVKTGMQVEIASESRNKTWKGVVKRVGSNVDPATQSVNIFVSLNSSGREVLDGQYLEVRIPAKRIAEVMEIPRNALPRPGHVFIVEDSLLKVHPIQIEKLNEESLYFTGVKEGASVVVEPLINAFENMPVSPKPAL
jgi:multidrug efflux pump subunit AcrA (membrane-fusion protein)